MEESSVVLPEVTIVYPALFKPTIPRGSAPDTTPTFQLTVLLPANFDKSGLNRILLSAARGLFGADAEKQIAAGAIKSPYRNQAEKAAAGKEGYSMEPGAKYINLRSERQPGVVDAQLQPLLDPSKIYGGCVCNVQVSAYAWNHPTGGRGLSFSLQNVQLVRDGARLGNAAPDPKTVFKPLGVPTEGKTAEAAVADLFR
jgi:hypothetical protein